MTSTTTYVMLHAAKFLKCAETKSIFQLNLNYLHAKIAVSIVGHSLQNVAWF